MIFTTPNNSRRFWRYGLLTSTTLQIIPGLTSLDRYCGLAKSFSPWPSRLSRFRSCASTAGYSPHRASVVRPGICPQSAAYGSSLASGLPFSNVDRQGRCMTSSLPLALTVFRLDNSSSSTNCSMPSSMPASWRFRSLWSVSFSCRLAASSRWSPFS